MDKKKRLRKQADKLWFEILIKPKCEVCDSQAKQVHHFFPKSSYGHLRYNMNNGINLCMHCHLKIHLKGDPQIIIAIKKKRGKVWYNNLLKEARDRPQGSYQTIGYYQNIIEELNKQ